jgi:hypothetical protein
MEKKLSAKDKEIADRIKEITSNLSDGKSDKQRENFTKGVTQVAQMFANMRNLTNKQRVSMLPPINFLFRLDFYTFAVTYRNEGKPSISCELIAFTPIPNIDPPGTPIDQCKEIIINKNGDILSRSEFELWRRQNYPLEHEDGRNPNNATLGVHHGTLGSDGKIRGQ